MKSSENSCKHDELAGFGSGCIAVVGLFSLWVDSFWVSTADDLYGVDVKILLSILLPTGEVFDQTDVSALNELNPLVDCSLLALYQPSFGDKSCGRSKLAPSDEKLSTEWLRMDEDGESQILWPLDIAGDWICGGVYQTELLLESFLIISADCDNFELGLSHRFDGVDVDFLNWLFNWSRCVLFGDDCVDVHNTSLLAL